MVFRDVYPPSVRVPLEPEPEPLDVASLSEPAGADYVPERPAVKVRDLSAPDFLV